MKKMMFVGAVSAGKTTLCQAVHNWELKYKKTQQVEFLNNIIDTPGEYAEFRIDYRVLAITAANADVVVLLQSVSDKRNIYAPGFCSMFNRPCIGVVTKIDLSEDEKELINAEKKLRHAGCTKIFRLSSVTQEGIKEFREFMEQ